MYFYIGCKKIPFKQMRRISIICLKGFLYIEKSVNAFKKSYKLFDKDKHDSDDVQIAFMTEYNKSK